MALSGLQAPLLLFSAGAAAASSPARRRHAEPLSFSPRSIGARRPLDLGANKHDADSSPSWSAAVVTIMKNLFCRVIASGALQDKLSDDAGERWSGICTCGV